MDFILAKIAMKNNLLCPVFQHHHKGFTCYCHCNTADIEKHSVNKLKKMRAEVASKKMRRFFFLLIENSIITDDKIKEKFLVVY